MFIIRPPPSLSFPGMTRTLAHVVRITMVALSLAPAIARAQAACASASQDPAMTARRWSPPLDRVISLHERGVSLRVALDRLAAAARIRLAYSAELLPLDQRVCVTVVLAPARTPATSASGAVSTRRADVLSALSLPGPLTDRRTATFPSLSTGWMAASSSDRTRERCRAC